MKKTLLVCIFSSLLMLLFTACTTSETYDSTVALEESGTSEENTDENDKNELTLNFSFGTRTGIYSGEVNDDGLPNGYGKFTSHDPSSGEEWTYEGDWASGHWNGSGTTTWSNGDMYCGTFENDVESGIGTYNYSDGTFFEGEFSDTFNATGFYEENGSRFYAEIVDGDLIVGGVWRTGDFGDELNVYQGNWNSLDWHDNFVVISGESINIVTERERRGKRVRDIETFYFSHDENNELIVVNEDDTPCYNISINSDNTLSISSEQYDTSYEKVSDNIKLPEQLKEPAIGMDKMDIYGSTWGGPSRRNKTTTAYGEIEQWVYDFGYIYFENGIVTSIQER